MRRMAGLGKTAVFLFIILLELGSFKCHAKKTIVNYKPGDTKVKTTTTTEPPKQSPVFTGEKSMEEILNHPHFRYRKNELGEDPNVWGDALSAYDTMLKFRENRQLDENGGATGVYQPGLFVPLMDLSDSFASKQEYNSDDQFKDDYDENRLDSKGSKGLSGRRGAKMNDAVSARREPEEDEDAGSFDDDDGSGTETETETETGGASGRQGIIGETNKNVSGKVKPSDQIFLEDRVLKNQVFNLSIYDKCGGKAPNGKTCFEWEGGCIKNKKCRMLATMQLTPADKINTTLMVSDARLPDHPWVGLGFSSDSNLGDDLLVYCIDNKNASQKGNVSVFITFIDNDHRTNIQVNKTVFSNNVKPVNGFTTKGILVCSFELSQVITLDNDKEFNIMNKSFHQILTYGQYIKKMLPTDVKFGAIDKSLVTIFSRNQEVLSKSLEKPKIIDGRSYIFIIIHVWFAVFAHMFLLPSGMIVAKFGREVYGTKTKSACWKLPKWLLVHIRMSIVGLIFILLSLIAIFIELGMTWQSKHSYEKLHSLIGFVSMGVALLIAISGWCFRFENPHNSVDVPKMCTRIGAWIHWFLGNISYFTGVFCVITASKMQRALAPCMVEYFGYLQLIIHIVVMVIMSIDTCRLVMKIDGRYMFQRAILGPMIAWTPSEVSKLVEDSFEDAPVWKMRRRVVIVHFFTSLLCALGISIFMLLPTVLCRHQESFISI